MSTMTKTALSDCSYPESTVYNIRDDINATITRLKVVIDEEASLRKALRALFIKRREEALEQVRLANVHLDLVNEEEATFCDDLMKAAASTNEGLEGSGCAGSVRTGGIAMHTFFQMSNASHENDPSLNKVEGNRSMTPVSPKMLHRSRGIVPSQTPASPRPPHSTHAFTDEPTRLPVESTRGIFEGSSKSPERSTHGLLREPPRSPARSAYSFAPPRSPAGSERFVVATSGYEPKKAGDAKTTNAKKKGKGKKGNVKNPNTRPNLPSPTDETPLSLDGNELKSQGSMNLLSRMVATSGSPLPPIHSECTEGDRYDDPRFDDQRSGARDDRSRRHDYPTSVSSRVQSSRYAPRVDQRSCGRGLIAGVDTASTYSRQTDQRPLAPAAVSDDRSTRDDPVFSSRFSMSTTAASVPPHLKSRLKGSPTEPVPELKPRQLTDAEMYRLSKVGDFFNFMAPTKKPEELPAAQTAPTRNPFRF